MTSKPGYLPLTVEIPPPDEYGRCSAECPFAYEYETGDGRAMTACSGGFCNLGRAFITPGTGCPQKPSNNEKDQKHEEQKSHP